MTTIVRLLATEADRLADCALAELENPLFVGGSRTDASQLRHISNLRSAIDSLAGGDLSWDLIARIALGVDDLVRSLRTNLGGVSNERRLVGMVMRYLGIWHPLLSTITMIAGFIESGENFPVIQWGRFRTLVESPRRYLADVFLGGENPSAERIRATLLPKLAALLSILGCDAQLESREDGSRFVHIHGDFWADGVLDGVGILLGVTSQIPPAPLVEVVGETSKEFSFRDIFRGSLRLTATTGGRCDANLTAQVSAAEERPMTLLGEPAGTRLELRSVAIAGSFRVSGDRVESYSASIDVRGLRMVIASVDGFLRTVAGDGVSAELNFSVSASRSRGVVFQGGGGAKVESNFTLGACRGTFGAEVGVLDGLGFVAAGLSLQCSLGPIAVSVGRMELRFYSRIWGEPRGAARDVGVEFVGPSGLGLRVSAGCVEGGGFVQFDRLSGRYSGALSLTIGDIALRAIGILDTRSPGVSGYSFLIVISAEFTPIQLGFGFTLTGVGGLCGIQRAVSVTALQEGVRSGTLASLLFSRDPIGQATQLIAGLQRAFPPTADRYVFGPMFKLGWGTPTLITADLGIVLQLPSPIIIALLGTLSAKIPRPEGAVVEINLDILGVLDLGEKKLSIDASLRDSRIAAFTLTGDLALRYSWGAEPDFALSLGGFNPAFRPPPGFPTLRRLSLALGSGNNPRLSLSAYFALTSNSLQFGARAEVYAEALGFNILGYLEFHALFIFSPFSFRFDFAAGVALRRGTSVLMAVSVVGRLEGPRPWHVLGSASISILFFEVTVSFDETFGDPPERARIEPVNLWDPLLAALRDLRNWSATLPSGTSRGVSTAADGEQPARVRLDPMSVLAVRQKVMPLDRRITKLGESPIEGPTRIRVGAVRVGCDALGVGGTNVQHEALNEPFAAAQYESLNDAQRLSRPSFEPMAAGAQAQGRALATERPVVHRPRIETIRVDRDPSVAQVLQQMHGQMAQVDSASVAALRTSGAERYAPGFGAVPMMTLAPELWALASTNDLRAPTGSTGGTWGVVAEEARMRGDAGAWQVVPSHEVRP